MIDDIASAAPPDPATAPPTFDAFFEAQYARAVRVAYLLTSRRDVAEDIAQDVFADLLGRWSTLRQPEAYLWRALTNGARQWGRKARRSLPAAPVEVVPGLDGDAVAVRLALAELSPPQREALVLRFYGGFRERDIAAATGRPRGTVKSDLRRGLAALEEHLR